MTRNEQSLYRNYCRATAKHLTDVYKSYSKEKFDAFKSCVKRCVRYGGYDARICTANGFMFTYAFKYMKDGAERMCYITRNNMYDFEIEKEV